MFLEKYNVRNNKWFLCKFPQCSCDVQAHLLFSIKCTGCTAGSQQRYSSTINTKVCVFGENALLSDKSGDFPALLKAPCLLKVDTLTCNAARESNTLTVPVSFILTSQAVKCSCYIYRKAINIVSAGGGSHFKTIIGNIGYHETND